MDKETEYDLIRKKPYQYIQDYADMRLIIVGRQAFKRLALIPPTLLLPDISSNIISNISGFILGDSGIGKSSICKIISPLCFQPLIRRIITEADLIATASEMRLLTIIIEDLTQSVTNEGYGLIKVLEGITGEERQVGKSTLNTEYTEEVKAIGIFGITPPDLERYAKDMETGLLSRCIIILLNLKKEDYRKIAEFMTLKAGDLEHTKKIQEKEEIVTNFYQELIMIQRGRHKDYLEETFGKNHNKQIIEAVRGYNIESKMKKELLARWNKISDNMLEQGQKPNNRDLAVYYKFLVALAFLNIHNRKMENGILFPNEEDHKIALDMALENMKWKWALPLALKYNKKASSIESLEKILNNGLPEIVKEILINISPFGKNLRD